MFLRWRLLDFRGTKKMERLKSKRALITGGTTGIGLETARQFLYEGARVIATGKNPASLELARKELGKEAIVVESDAGDVSAQENLAKIVVEEFGELDILAVNAGIVDMRPLEKWDEAGFERSFAIHVKGPSF
jgi:NAD(P)-dependent dehydrogenase (short-subunit alcohol dehydrogenase family)